MRTFERTFERTFARGQHRSMARSRLNFASFAHGLRLEDGDAHLSRRLTMRTPHLLAITLMLTGSLATACLDPGGSASLAPTNTELLSDDTVVYDTVVFQDANGIMQSREVPITMGERRAQEAARAAAGEQPATDDLGSIAQAAITTDTYCSTTSFWAYDSYGLAGKRLCLQNQTDGTTSANLSNWCYEVIQNCTPLGCIPFCTSWSGKILSFYSGAKVGELLNGPGPGRFFGAYTSDNVPAGFSVTSLTLQCPPVGAGGIGGGPPNSSCSG